MPHALLSTDVTFHVAETLISFFFFSGRMCTELFNGTNTSSPDCIHLYILLFIILKDALHFSKKQIRLFEKSILKQSSLFSIKSQCVHQKVVFAQLSQRWIS